MGRGEKGVIFTQWIRFIDIITNRLLHENIGVTTIKGSMSKTGRQKSIKQFKESPDCRFIIISIQSGAIGLNLVNANNVMMLDPCWNPAQENQALSRVHRIGQEKEVNIYKFLMKDSIEEKIEKMHEKKRYLTSQVIDGKGG